MTNWKRTTGRAAVAAIGLTTLIATAPAFGWDRGDVDTFAVLPAGAPMIEGLTVANDGKVYVSTFDPTGHKPAQLFVFDDDGHLLRSPLIIGASTATLGLAFHPTTHALLVIDFGACKVLNVNPQNGASSVFMTLPATEPCNGSSNGLNALTFDSFGNVYVSDSFRGTIWKTGSGGGVATNWVTDPTLKPNGIPPFGANGLQFNKAQSKLFVANTANDTLVQVLVTNTGTDLIPTPTPPPGPVSVFTNSINGADGIVLDDQDNIWVAANQADEIVVVDPTGKAIAKLGDFNGIKNGVTRGLLFPASPDFSKDGKSLFVTNLELDLRPIVGQQSVDSQWAAQVQQHSIAKLRAKIPPFPKGD